MLQKKIGHDTECHKKDDYDKHLDHARRHVMRKGTRSNIHDHNLDILPMEASQVAVCGDLHYLDRQKDEYLDPE